MQLMQGDCLERMKEIPAGGVDMVLCDLPYGITQSKWDTVIPFDALWEQYGRVCKPNAAIVLFCAEPFTSRLIMSNLGAFKYIWIWFKHYKRGFLNAKKMPMKTTEQIAVFYRKQCTYKPKMKKGKYRNKGKSGKKSECYGDYKLTNTTNDIYFPTDILDFAGVPVPELTHPNQKPTALLEYLIETYTNEGETVLDNCMGSGSTGVACVNTGRDFIGIEIDEEYYKIACERIEDTRRLLYNVGK